MSDDTIIPPTTIAVVTPSYQQAPFLEASLRSVIDQHYPSLEYVVVDGGSTDGSVNIINRYKDSLLWCVSERDNGHYDAVDKGFRATSADVMCWLNSDDVHLPWTLSVVGQIFAQRPEVEWITSRYPLMWDEAGRAVRCEPLHSVDSSKINRGHHLPTGARFASGYIQQESTFWRRSLWDRAGGRVATGFELAGDFDLWLRFSQHATLYAVDTPLAGFRRQREQRTATRMDQYLEEAAGALRLRGGRPRTRLESKALAAAQRLAPPVLRRRLPQQPSTHLLYFDEERATWSHRLVPAASGG